MLPYLFLVFLIGLLSRVPSTGSTFTAISADRVSQPGGFLLRVLSSSPVLSTLQQQTEHMQCRNALCPKSPISPLRAYRKHVEEPMNLDSVFVGEYSATWTIRDFRRKVLWRQRSAATPALATSRFSLAGIRDFRLKLLPCGNLSSEEGYLAVHLDQVEKWRELIYPITITVGGITRGPLTYRSPEYFKASNSFCKLEDVKLDDDSLQVVVEITPG